MGRSSRRLELEGCANLRPGRPSDDSERRGAPFCAVLDSPRRPNYGQTPHASRRKATGEASPAARNCGKKPLFFRPEDLIGALAILLEGARRGTGRREDRARREARRVARSLSRRPVAASYDFRLICSPVIVRSGATKRSRSRLETLDRFAFGSR
ncbi:MAG: hypothetical protein C3F11_16020 [Methylocystaceae bacterium]|nr:MAG: hypothetical protein C3F11_16020 [Methylocystaceae bacterium]